MEDVKTPSKFDEIAAGLIAKHGVVNGAKIMVAIGQALSPIAELPPSLQAPAQELLAKILNEK